MSGFRVFGIVMAIIFVIALVVTGSWAIRYYTAEPKGIVEAEEQIQSGENRISEYNMFYDLCASVQRQKMSLQAQRERLEYLEPDTKEASRVHANIAGLKSQVQGTVSEYNSRSTRNYTSGQFRDSELPYKLNVEGETTCAAR